MSVRERNVDDGKENEINIGEIVVRDPDASTEIISDNVCSI